MATPPETLYAKALENVTKQAFQRGLSTEEFWQVLAGFVGFSMGNAPENSRDDIVEGVRVFSLNALTHALQRRAEVVPVEKVN